MSERLQVVSTQTTSENGELLSQRTVTKTIVKKAEPEPPYVKCYLHDISILHKVQRFTETVMWELLKIMEFESNIIRLPAGTKKDLARQLQLFRQDKELGLIPNTNAIDQQLTKLVKTGLFSKKDTGVYVANPHFFGKGRWEDIRAIRLTITYASEKRDALAEIVKSRFNEKPDKE